MNYFQENLVAKNIFSDSLEPKKNSSSHELHDETEIK